MLERNTIRFGGKGKKSMGNSRVQQEFEFVTFQILARSDDALLTSFHTLSTLVIITDCLEALAIPVHSLVPLRLNMSVVMLLKADISKKGAEFYSSPDLEYNLHNITAAHSKQPTKWPAGITCTACDIYYKIIFSTSALFL